jgi:hypothetical protein
MTLSSNDLQPAGRRATPKLALALFGPVLGSGIAVICVVLMATISWTAAGGIQGILIGVCIGAALGGYVGWRQGGMGGALTGTLGGLGGAGIGGYVAIACREQWHGVYWAITGGTIGVAVGVLVASLIGATASGLLGLGRKTR